MGQYHCEDIWEKQQERYLKLKEAMGRAGYKNSMYQTWAKKVLGK